MGPTQWVLILFCQVFSEGIRDELFHVSQCGCCRVLGQLGSVSVGLGIVRRDMGQWDRGEWVVLVVGVGVVGSHGISKKMSKGTTNNILDISYGF